MNTITYGIDELAPVCKHDSKRRVRYVKSNGAICVRLQCEQCGDSLGEIPKRGIDVDALPEWDGALRAAYVTTQRQAIQAAWQQKQEAKDAVWWARYNGYLQTAHWRQLREQVYARDKGICQNCMRYVALRDTNCHHLSYVGFNRVGHSFAFECITLCRRCHDEYHSND